MFCFTSLLNRSNHVAYPYVETIVEKSSVSQIRVEKRKQ